MTVLTVAALAAPADFRPTKTTERCQLFLGPALSNGVVPMRAECRFPNVDFAKLDAAFSRWGDHDVPFSTVLSSEVVGAVGGEALVRQVHAVKGVADRECLLQMKRTLLPEGGARFSWTLAAGPQEVADGRVAVAFDDGMWEVTPHAEGGVSAIHQLAYDPGGRVPGFLVRWFQTAGLADIVEQMEAWASGL